MSRVSLLDPKPRGEVLIGDRREDLLVFPLVTVLALEQVDRWAICKAACKHCWGDHGGWKPLFSSWTCRGGVCTRQAAHPVLATKHKHLCPAVTCQPCCLVSCGGRAFQRCVSCSARLPSLSTLVTSGPLLSVEPDSDCGLLSGF